MFEKLRKLGIILFIAKAIKSIGIRLETSVKQRRYSKNKNAFNISVDDDEFQMSFLKYKIGKTIQERIEGIRETDTTSIIKSVLKPGNRVLEIGGCYGYFTMLMAKAVASEGKVVSIEGLPNNFEILKYNIQLNKFQNIDFYNYFIGNKGDVIRFKVDDTSPYNAIDEYQKGEHSVKKNDYDTVTVECINVAEFLQKIEFEPTHIFMDIEGFEIDALEQLCEQYLNVHSPMLIFEHHESMYLNGKGLGYIRELLEKNGYIARKVYGNIVAFKN